jgi:aconitase A
VKVQNLNEDKKTIKERRLIYQKIKPFMEAYGLQPELFQLKGKSIVFKSNNSINTSHLSRSGVTSKSVIIPNKARKISVKKKN